MQFLTRFQNVGSFDFSIFLVAKTLVIGFEMTLVGLEGKVTTEEEKDFQRSLIGRSKWAENEIKLQKPFHITITTNYYFI